MFKSFFASKKYFWWAYGIGALLLVLLFGQVYITRLFNSWEGSFWKIVQDSIIMNELGTTTWDILRDRLVDCAKELGGMIASAILLGSCFNYLAGTFVFKWRKAMTENFIKRWKKVSEPIEGASQRIQQDTESFAWFLEDMGIQATRAIMTLCFFLPLLSELNDKISHVGILDNIPGGLVTVALVGSVGGMIASWFIGIKLPKLEYEKQKTEAIFRKNLVFGEEDRKSFSLFTAAKNFSDIEGNYFRLLSHTLYFDIWMGLFSSSMYHVPLMMMGFVAVEGAIDLSLIKRILDAFSKVNGSFSLLVYNWKRITHFRSVLIRLKEFEKHLEEYEKTKSLVALEKIQKMSSLP